nr:odorant receptor 67a-like [Drosophila suzukii]
MIDLIKQKIFGRPVKSVKKPKNAYYVVGDFLRWPVIFYNTLGIVPYENNQNPGLWFYLYFLLLMINMVITVIESVLFALISFRKNNDVLEGCILCGYIAFTVTGVLKIITVVMQKEKLTTLVRRLKSCFPQFNEMEQEQFAVKTYLKRCHLFTKCFSVLLMAMFFTHSLSAIVIYAFQKLWLRSLDAKQSLPFFDYAPWDWRGSWKYYITYVGQSLSGYAATCGNMSCDLMIFAMVFQVTMYFDRLSKALREFRIRRHGRVDETSNKMEELRSLIVYHIKILGLTDLMNAVFGVPLLLNFLASSWLVCLVGFQLTIDFSPEPFCKQVLLLVSALVEIFLLCSFSQMLINASENVRLAVYEMNWTEAEPRFRKMLILLSLRARKPICLNATVLLNVSIETMSIFLRVSYKFFCAVRMMYK